MHRLAPLALVLVLVGCDDWLSFADGSLDPDDRVDGYDCIDLDDDDDDPDRDTLVELLQAHQGVVAAVAKAAGRSTKQVYRWLRQHGLEPGDYRA